MTVSNDYANAALGSSDQPSKPRGRLWSATTFFVLFDAFDGTSDAKWVVEATACGCWSRTIRAVDSEILCVCLP